MPPLLGLMHNERTGTGFEIIDSVSMYRGIHGVKVGVNVRRKQTEVIQAGYPTMSFGVLALSLRGIVPC